MIRRGSRRWKEALIPPLPETVQRVWQLSAVLGFVLVIVLYKIWSLQVLESEIYIVEAQGNVQRDVIIPSERGRILDRYGRVLAEDVTTYDVFLERKGQRLSDLKETIARLKTVISTDRHALREKDIHGRYRVGRQIRFEEMVRLRERQLEFPGVIVEGVPGRRYPHGDLAAHILGYTNEIKKSELESREGYRLGDRMGRSGVEKTYESLLRGKDGVRIVEVNSHGIQQRVLRTESEDVRGQDVVLALDLHLQRVCEEVLGVSRGTIIVNDPRDGSVLAMASNPRFNPNTYSKDLGRLVNDESHPLTHRAIQGLYPPGSTFKLFESIGLLESTDVTVGHKVGCPGYFRLGSKNVWKCHKKTGHGAVDLYDAIKLSCDCYFYTMGRKMGIQKIADWATQFGLGVPTGIDLPAEKSIPFPSRKTINPWYPGETINVSIGQGKIQITPLQLAVASATLANASGATSAVFVPHVGRGYLTGWNEDGTPIVNTFPARVARVIEADPRSWEAVQKGAWLVCNDFVRGTGRRGRVEGFVMSGKTGTAQHGGSRYTNHAWFVCWGPTGEGQRPEIVITILAEESGHGGENASVLVPAIVEAYRRGKGQELV